MSSKEARQKIIHMGSVFNIPDLEEPRNFPQLHNPFNSLASPILMTSLGGYSDTTMMQ